MQQIAFWFCARRSVSSCTRLHQFSHAPDCMGFSANVGVYSRAPVCSYHAPDCMLWSAPVCICNSVMSTVCNLRPFAVFHRARSLVFNCDQEMERASQQLSVFGNVLFRNVAETLLWWLVRLHYCGEMTRCKVVQNHLFYNAQETSLPPIRLARTPKW